MAEDHEQAAAESAGEAATWAEDQYIAVPDDDPVFGEPSDQTPSFEGLLSALPLRGMGWQKFEMLLNQLAREVDGLRQVRRFGSPGQEQGGIDVIGFTQGDRNPIAYQGKDVDRFDEAELRKAIDRFLNGRRPFGVRSLRICTSQYLERTQAQELLDSYQRSNPGVALAVWDAEEINEYLRVRPALVERFFGREARDRFCLNTSQAQTPTDGSRSDQISLTLVMRGPLDSLGLTDQVENADRISGSDPMRAAEIYLEVSQTLRASGYPAFGHHLMDEAIQRYTLAGEPLLALPVVISLVSEHLWNGNPNRAHRPLLRLQQMAGMDQLLPAPEEVAELDSSITEKAAALIVAQLLTEADNILNDPIPLEELREVSESIYSRIRDARGLLAAPESSPFQRSAWQAVGVCSAIILNFVNCLDGPRSTVEQVGLLSEIAQQLRLVSQGEFAHLQLQVKMATADLSENAATMWADLYAAANDWSFAAGASAFMYARYASRVINDGQPDLADDLYRRAIERSIEADQFKEAAEWIEARERIRSKFGLFLSDAEDRLRMARILRDRQGKSAATRIDGLISDSREKIRRGELRAAVLFAVRACVDARSNGFWQSELEARQLCSDAYQRSGAGDSAAYFAISSTDPKVSRNCGAALTDYVDTSPALASRSRLRKKAAFELTAAQANLVPDDSVDEILRLVSDFVLELNTGEPRPLPVFGRETFFVAFNLAASLIDRASFISVGWVLDAIESLERKADAHYHSDEPIAKILGTLIGLSELNIRERAATLLTPILASNPQAVRSGDLSRVSKISPSFAAQILLPHVAEESRTIARLAIESRLVTIDSSAPESTDRALEQLRDEVRKHSTKARDSLLQIPAGIPNGAAMLGGLASDALFVTALPVEDRIRVVEHLKSRSQDSLHLRSSRFAMLTSLQVLACGPVGDEIGEEVLNSLFELGVAFAKGGNPQSPHEIETGPLDAFRMDWGPESLAVSGLELANVASRSESQKRTVDRLIEALPSRSLNDFQGRAVASIVAPRTYEIRPDTTLGVRTLARLGTETLRAAAAVRWVNTMGLVGTQVVSEEDDAIGIDLAEDESQVVRETLARALRLAIDNDRTLSARSREAVEILKQDKLWSVRRALTQD